MIIKLVLLRNRFLVVTFGLIFISQWANAQ